MEKAETVAAGGVQTKRPQLTTIVTSVVKCPLVSDRRPHHQDSGATSRSGRSLLVDRACWGFVGFLVPGTGTYTADPSDGPPGEL
jgi:hypothetical protein